MKTTKKAVESIQPGDLILSSYNLVYTVKTVKHRANWNDYVLDCDGRLPGSFAVRAGRHVETIVPSGQRQCFEDVEVAS